jgi:hypothetical protein
MSLLDFSEVEFEPEHEAWNLYEVSDGTALRIRSLLLKLFRINQAEPTYEAADTYSGRFQNVITVKRANPWTKWPPGARRLTPLELQDQPRINEEFSTLSEEWNRYRLETGDILKVKLVATKVERVKGGWDEFGDPLYTVSSINVVQTINKSQAR